MHSQKKESKSEMHTILAKNHSFGANFKIVDVFAKYQKLNINNSVITARVIRNVSFILFGERVPTYRMIVRFSTEFLYTAFVCLNVSVYLSFQLYR